MALKLYDTREAVPEAHRAAALETADHKFVIEEVDPALGEAGRRAIQEEREARKTEKARADKAEADLAELKRTEKAKAAGISEQELTQIREAERLARKPLEDELATTKAENRKLKLTDRVQVLALHHGVMAERIEDAMMHLDKRTDLTDADGIVVKDKAGKVTTETIDDFLKTTFKVEKPWLYAGSNAAGSGANGSRGSREEPPAPANEDAKAKKRQQVAGSL